MRSSFLFLTIAAALSACSTADVQCRAWKFEGQMYSTINSCRQCVDTLGSDDMNAVRGCALGLDAAQLLTPR